MRTRLLMPFVFVVVALWANVTTAGNIAHGVKVVVIDAGHGGKFPGAHYGGVYEKDLTLSVALKLGKLIEEEMPGVKVVYTRKTDKTLGNDLASDLQARADIANKAEGDIFISIHVNAAKSTSARGVETLIMGESSKEQRYNESALYENNREDLIDMSDARTAAIVRAYIQNLQFTYGEYSMAMARCIQNNYQKAGRHMRGIKPQLLRVLYATDMPGVLTEIGFMSNAQEGAYMKSEKGQHEIAQSLYRAVRDYSNHLKGVRGEDDTVATTAIDDPAADAMESPEMPAAKDAAADPKNEGDATEKQPASKPIETSKKTTTKQPKVESKSTKVRYAVQVVASTKAEPLNSGQFKSYRGKVKQYSSEGKFRYKYCVGECNDQAVARKKLAEVRKVFPQAFIVRTDGKQILK